MGRVARTKAHQTRDRARQLNRWPVAMLIGLCCLCLSASAFGQSGRRGEPGKSSKPRPMSDPDRPGTSSSPNRPTKASDEVDPDDVVRISSDLVPIPASVVDKRGNAIVNL